jgi:hypothetical protein
VPVGVVVPLTFTATESDCAVVTLDDAGVTVTVGATVVLVTVTAEDAPVALLKVEELEESGV